MMSSMSFPWFLSVMLYQMLDTSDISDKWAIMSIKLWFTHKYHDGSHLGIYYTHTSSSESYIYLPNIWPYQRLLDQCCGLPVLPSRWQTRSPLVLFCHVPHTTRLTKQPGYWDVDANRDALALFPRLFFFFFSILIASFAGQNHVCIISELPRYSVGAGASLWAYYGSGMLEVFTDFFIYSIPVSRSASTPRSW